MKEKKKINKTRVVLIFWLIASIILTCISLPLYIKNPDNKHIKNFLLVSLLLLWNFWIRVISGLIFTAFTYNPESRWFKINDTDRKWHNFIKVKKWIQHAPTFNPKQYDSKTLTLDEIIQNTCRNEVSHIMYFIETYMGILLSLYFGNYLLTIIVAITVSIHDIFLISLQRFSRDRLNKLNKRMKRTQAKTS
ncbi:MAG: hypothetical protein K6E20_01935 [Acholeplasmatales bacterium]|nr:hypothetical protein [Acholeplasmatales bacterium]